VAGRSRPGKRSHARRCLGRTIFPRTNPRNPGASPTFQFLARLRGLTDQASTEKAGGQDAPEIEKAIYALPKESKWWIEFEMMLSRLSDYWRGPVLSGEADSPPWLPLDRKIAVVLFLTALAVYLPGIWWGLPSGTSPMQVLPWGADELGPLGPVAELYGDY